MKMSITGSESFTIAGQTIDKLIRAGDGDAALLYLYMLRTHGQSTDKEAEEALGKGKGWVASATALLSRMGLVEVASDKPVAAPKPVMIDEPREYSQDEVIAEIESGSEFSVVVDETARRLGKPLSSDEMLRLYGIYDNLRLPPEVILLLITHCIKESRASGGGRMPSIRYIEKAAYTWEREGVFSIEKAEEYLKALEEQRSARGRIRQILQIKDREFSETEKQYVDKWIKMGFEPEAIAKAYDKTIIGTGGKLVYQYMDTILSSWDAKGLHSAAQVQGKGSVRNKSSAYNTQTGRTRGTSRHGEPSREEMERMRRLREKLQ